MRSHRSAKPRRLPGGTASQRRATVDSLAPALWVWSVVEAAIFQALPSAFGNILPSVVLAAVGGTF